MASASAMALPMRQNKMTEIITYSLKNGQKYSDAYYQDITEFTNEVLAEISHCSMGLIEDFRTFIQTTRGESLRSYDEYAFEILTLGTLWRIYGPTALHLTTTPQRLLAGLARIRKRIAFLKPVVDFWRGVLGTIYLSPRNGQTRRGFEPSLENLDQLLAWMAASGDFNEEVKRLGHWRKFLRSRESQKLATVSKTADALKTVTSLATWFEARSLKVLGEYTQNVEQFLKEKHPNYRWREDVIFCGRQRVEYHLYMVGAEILNRAFREKFLKTGRKVVLLPPCMKAKLESGCEAIETPLGERCAACTPGCRVNQVTKLGEKYGFDVFIMPHELSVFSNGGIKPANDQQFGVVGVSCPLTNLTGGWETKDLGVPAQGVLLDYCGCPWHWHEEGISTDINFNQLLDVVGIQKSLRN
jgi:hypothetical protein